MLSVKQGGIKYHFLSLWYDSTWDWTQVSRAIGEHSNRYAQILTKHNFAILKKAEVIACKLLGNTFLEVDKISSKLLS